MIPYILLMFVPLLFSVVACSKALPGYKGKRSFVIGSSPEIIKHSVLIPIFFFILFLILAFRDESIGRDMLNYKHFFFMYRDVSFRSIFSEESDTLFWGWNWLVARFTDNFQVFVALTAAITILPIVKVYSEDREYGFMKIVLFMNMSTFVMLFSGLRQAVAISFGLIAYEYVKQKRPWMFMLVALIALGFHHTAFVLFALYPIYHFKIKKNNLIFVIPVILFVFAFNGPIFSFATTILTSLFGERYDIVAESTGAYTMLIVFIVFAILAYILPDESKIDEETLGLRNYLLMAILFQCFASVHALAMRMNYYFIIFIPILMSKIFKNVKGNMKDVELVAKYGIILFFTAYYLYTTYVSCQTGQSVLNTYPYVPFWK